MTAKNKQFCHQVTPCCVCAASACLCISTFENVETTQSEVIGAILLEDSPCCGTQVGKAHRDEKRVDDGARQPADRLDNHLWWWTKGTGNPLLSVCSPGPKRVNNTKVGSGALGQNPLFRGPTK